VQTSVELCVVYGWPLKTFTTENTKTHRYFTEEAHERQRVHISSEGYGFGIGIRAAQKESDLRIATAEALPSVWCVPSRPRTGFYQKHIYGRIVHMKRESVRTTVDIPTPLYRKLKEQAAARGSSVRELVLAGVRVILLKDQRPQPKKVQFPLIKSRGPKVNLTNDQIYEHVEFP